MKNFLKASLRSFSNIPGWRTTRKLIIFESDDWGAIRMPSSKVYQELCELGFRFSNDEKRYLENDCLASEEDLGSLFDILSAFKDCEGRHAVFTAMSLVANPDFVKIKESGFSQYFYQPFTQTLDRYPCHAKSFSLWKEGIQANLFYPQFHGREHLNVQNWMKALQLNNPDTMAAFKRELYGISPRAPINNISYQAAFDINEPGEVDYQKEIIKTGLALFENLFGYKATFFVPPNGPFNNSLEEVAASQGIKYMSASKVQREPLGNEKFKRHFHYLGQKNKHGQIYLTRNCFFEPNASGKDWVGSCLSDISLAFKWRKPAVISTHRVNYIGGLNPKNRDKGLAQLKLLFAGILKNWPDAEFITSVELGNLITISK